MVADACAASYTADINLVSGNTATGIVRERVDSLGSPISGTWSRVADEISEARVIIDTTGDCGAQLNRWRSYLGFIELAINRGAETVWAGPITDIAQSRRGRPATVSARDIGYWLSRAQLWGTGYTGTGDVATLAQAALTQSLTTASIPGATFRVDSGLIRANWAWAAVGETIAYEVTEPSTTPLAVLDDLTDYGLTWTVAAYRLLGGPRPAGASVPTETVTDQDFTDELDVSVSIDDLTTHATAENNAGTRRSSNVAGDQLPRLETVVNTGDTANVDSLRVAARRALFWPARPVIASPSGRMLREPNFARAIPGRVVWEVQTEFLGQRIRQSMHLESLQVDWVADGAEDIKPGLTPIGAAVALDVAA
jgi:hypothetical protein